ncbi:RNA polymerase sigma-70 factor [Flavitalea flava]
MPIHMGVLFSDNEKDGRSLFEAIALGDTAAFSSLFKSYRARVYSLAFKWTKSTYAAEEITQDVFISIWTGRTNLPSVKDPRAYLYTIVYNKISRHLKKEANKNRILLLSQWHTRDAVNETEEKIYLSEGQRFVNSALAKLSPQKKIIYDLSRNKGKSYEEIGESLHLSPHTVKSHLGTALKFIRNYLKNNALLLAGLLSSFFSH